jgi:hypothetical protein
MLFDRSHLSVWCLESQTSALEPIATRKTLQHGRRQHMTLSGLVQKREILIRMISIVTAVSWQRRRTRVGERRVMYARYPVTPTESGRTIFKLAQRLFVIRQPNSPIGEQL